MEFLAALEGWEVRPRVEPERSDPAANAEEERRLKRMMSNRESARRSRMRKQRHLEDLRSQLSQHGQVNRELSNRLGAVVQYSLLLRCDNDRLRSESASLSCRLAELRRLLLFRHLQRLNSPASAALCGGFGPGAGAEPNMSSIIVNKQIS